MVGKMIRKMIDFSWQKGISRQKKEGGSGISL